MTRQPAETPTSPRRSWMVRRFRLLIGAAAGIGGGVITHFIGAVASTTVVVGWNVGALVYLALSWRLIMLAGEDEVRRRAGEEDETRFGVIAIVVAAIVASLAAIVIMLVRARQAPHGWEQAVAPALAVLTLVVSWLVLQTVFVLHYAHRHFGDRNRDGAGDGGFVFPGEPASTYRDFVYLSLCIGATFAVSDPQVTRTSLRNLVAAHSAMAYFYNTAILALGINIVAGLIGH